MGEKMRYLVFILAIGSVALAKGKTKSLTKETPKAPTEYHIMSGMTLQGQMKRPELAYSYSREELQNDQVLELPENFNDEIVQDAQ